MPPTFTTVNKAPTTTTTTTVTKLGSMHPTNAFDPQLILDVTKGASHFLLLGVKPALPSNSVLFFNAWFGDRKDVQPVKSSDIVLESKVLVSRTKMKYWSWGKILGLSLALDEKLKTFCW